MLVTVRRGKTNPEGESRDVRFVKGDVAGAVRTLRDASSPGPEDRVAGCNLGLLLRRLTGVGTPRSLQGRALSAILGLIDRLTDLWGRLNGLGGAKWAPDASWGSAARPQAA